MQDNTTRTIQIVSGAPNVTFTSPNQLTLRLPNNGYRTDKDEMCLKSLSVFYSWPNISAARGNNTFSYIWLGTTHSVVIADGIWTFPDLNAYLRQVMRSRGQYLVNTAGEDVYYIDLTANSTLYCLSLTCTPLPNTLPAGWTNPSGMVLNGNCPQLVIPASFSKLSGFAAGTYPTVPQTAVYQVNSGIPQISDTTSLNLVSNLPNNSGFSMGPNVLATFNKPDGQLPGSLMTIQPFTPDWVPVQQQQTFQEIELRLVDQLFRPVEIRDPAGMVAIINLRRRR